MKKTTLDERVEILTTITKALEISGLAEKHGRDYCGYLMMCFGASVINNHYCICEVTRIFEKEIIPNLLKDCTPINVKKPVVKKVKKVIKKVGKK